MKEETIKNLKEKIQNLEEELGSLIQVKDEVIRNEMNLKNKLSILEQENDNLKSTLNDLANMYDDLFEYFKDEVMLSRISQRNLERTFKLIEEQVSKFNEPKGGISQ